jgi:tripartite-type tricarboxylate transporter receptor subunit TctC
MTKPRCDLFDPVAPVRRQVIRAILASLGMGAAQVHSQSPQPRLVLGFGAGGTSDVAARALSGSLRGVMGGEVVVENRAGAGARIALEHVRAAAADGSVALLVPDATMTLYPHVYRQLAYDPERDFVPVARVASLAIALYVGAMVPASVTNLAEFIDWVRVDPLRATFGTPAAGATPHFVGDMFARAAGLSLTAIHYRGSGPGIQDLVGGHLPAFFGAVPDGVAMANLGRVRALATSGPQRSSATPHVPTFGEQQFDNFVVEDGLGVYLPAAAPRPVVERLADALKSALESPDVRRGYEAIGLDRAYEPPEAFARRLRIARGRWAIIIRETGFKALDDR